MALIGLKDIHYVPLKKDDSDTLEYDTNIKRIAGAITAKISPKASTEKIYYDDMLGATSTALGEIDVEIEMQDLPLEVRAEWTGNKIVNGVLREKANAAPIELALGFKSEKHEGGYRYIWLTKGKAEPVEDEHKTKEDKVDFQTKKIKLTFMPRMHDEEYRLLADDDNPEFTGADKWFTIETLTGKIESETPQTGE
ncbi:phage major tail protein, phi13 family [Gottschalkia purinilytica]|uniref:Phage major tail protein, phi13 family n=1 Tax=Gottschalkia purinilytica TaxID=1503 RepID=A0A0L0W645_GOTPU|nr:major tail protein [Gottschalkia purinilytica]KNF06984.1 phage major tail protein, phi13 family [Gottschalkia purinilytica]